ncbi:hypothetical protein ES708_22010 [subsurface metagenome]
MTETTETKRRYFRKKKSKSKKKKKTGRIPDKSDDNKKIFESKKKKNFSEEEKKNYNIGEMAYNKALSHYFIPSIPDPEFIFDYSKTKGFYIDTFSWRVTLNLANTPFLHLDQEFLDYFFSLSLHEIAHYVYCPYDNLTNLRLLASAIKGGISKNYAPMVVNIFADLLIDNRTHKKFGDLMNWELRITAEQALQDNKKNKISKLWKLLVRCYEILWSIKIIPKTMISDDLNKLAGKCCEIILNKYQDETLWEKKVQKIAKILKDLLKEECSLANTTEDMEGRMRTKSGNKHGNPFSIPNDVLETFGDISEVKNIDMIKSGDSGNKKCVNIESFGFGIIENKFRIWN